MADIFTTTQQESFVGIITDRKGRPVTPVGNIVWAISDSDIATLTVAADGLSCVVGGLAVGSVVLSLTADGITATKSLSVTPASVASVEIVSGDVTEQI